MPPEIKGYDEFTCSPVETLDFDLFKQRVNPEDRYDLYYSTKARRFEVAILPLSNRRKLFTASLSAKLDDRLWGRVMTVAELRNGSGPIEQYIEVPLECPQPPEPNFRRYQIMRYDTTHELWYPFNTGTITAVSPEITSMFFNLTGVHCFEELPERVDVAATMKLFLQNINQLEFKVPQIVDAT